MFHELPNNQEIPLNSAERLKILLPEALKTGDYQGLYSVAVDVASYKDMQGGFPQAVCAGVYEAWGEHIDKLPSDKIRHLRRYNNDFNSIMFFLERPYSHHIGTLWIKDKKDPKPLLKESIHRYEKLGWTLPIVKLTNNLILCQYSEAIGMDEHKRYKEPEEVLAILQELSDNCNRQITIIDALAKDTGLLPPRVYDDEDANDHRFLTPCDLHNASGQIHIEVAREIIASGHIRGARTYIQAGDGLLTTGEEILKEVREEDRETLKYRKRSAALKSNQSLSSLVLADIELTEPSLEGEVFPSLMEDFMEDFTSFLNTVDKTSRPERGAKIEDGEPLPDYFGSEIILRFAYGTALFREAEKRLVRTPRIAKIEQDFLKILQEKFGLEDEDKANLVKTLLNRAEEAASTLDDKAEIQKYRRHFRRFGI